MFNFASYLSQWICIWPFLRLERNAFDSRSNKATFTAKRTNFVKFSFKLKAAYLKNGSVKYCDVYPYPKYLGLCWKCYHSQCWTHILMIGCILGPCDWRVGLICLFGQSVEFCLPSPLAVPHGFVCDPLQLKIHCPEDFRGCRSGHFELGLSQNEPEIICYIEVFSRILPRTSLQ